MSKNALRIAMKTSNSNIIARFAVNFMHTCNMRKNSNSFLFILSPFHLSGIFRFRILQLAGILRSCYRTA